ncbi:expansin-like B1 [Ziziphus jujuba]|uniref:Expansin-like B1 n=1 Tax=Ziziphus jujuba TaxID=326968 RepID=A0A6P4AKZ6_ZIZJJ|nr:expansin-like B1 [Ziziphus jujuba]
MGFTIEKQMVFLGLVVLFPLLCTSQNTFTSSRATYYGSPDCYGTPSGACGFGEYGRTVNYGNVAGVSRLYRNGTGCGACYQVRCTNPQYCSDDGANIVVTDYGEGDRTDFILSPRAYAKLAKANLALELFAYGVVDVEYRRISCKYSDYNLMFKVHEHSRYPHYLAIVILYVAGQNDITAVELWQEDYKEWRPMRRAYGAVFDLANPPPDSITLRFQVSGSAGYTWVQSNNAIPSYWKAGAVYDSTIQLT